MTVTTPISEVYATFAGGIDDSAVQRFFSAFNAGINNKVKRVHLLVHSSGGMISDGIALYNYLNSIPIEIYTYNMGQVSSIAVLPFLSGARRFASSSAFFMIHKSHVTPQTGTSTQLKEQARYLSLEDARVEGILKSGINLPTAKWRLHRYSNVHLTAEEAMSFGLITAVHDFIPPAGSQIYTI